MPGNESRVTAVAGHDAAGKSSAIHATECTNEDNRSTPTYQVFAQPETNHRTGSWRSIGSVAAEVVADLEFRRQVERPYAKGPRGIVGPIYPPPERGAS